MPQTIDVTGLTPDDVRAVEQFVGKLRAKESATNPLPAQTHPLGPPSQWPDEDWIKWLNDWVNSQPKRGGHRVRR